MLPWATPRLGGRPCPVTDWSPRGTSPPTQEARWRAGVSRRRSRTSLGRRAAGAQRRIPAAQVAARGREVTPVPAAGPAPPHGLGATEGRADRGQRWPRPQTPEGGGTLGFRPGRFRRPPLPGPKGPPALTAPRFPVSGSRTAPTTTAGHHSTRRGSPGNSGTREALTKEPRTGVGISATRQPRPLPVAPGWTGTRPRPALQVFEVTPEVLLQGVGPYLALGSWTRPWWSAAPRSERTPGWPRQERPSDGQRGARRPG